jgi:hypothetical protein
MMDGFPFLTRLTAAIFAGVAAYWLARGIGIADIALFVFLAIFLRRRTSTHG